MRRRRGRGEDMVSTGSEDSKGFGEPAREGYSHRSRAFHSPRYAQKRTPALRNDSVTKEKGDEG